MSSHARENESPPPCGTRSLENFVLWQPALAGSKGLFSPLQKALIHNKPRIHLTKDAHDFLDDFRWLSHNLHNRPTRLFELVPSPPWVIGATDASGAGLGGVFFVPTTQSSATDPSYHSFVWRHRLPDDIRARLISTNNPKGTITNSDLELAAAVAHPDVIASTGNISESTVATQHDNTANRILAAERLNDNHRPSCLSVTTACTPCSSPSVYIDSRLHTRSHQRDG
jgi:hypothetical protein